VVTKESPSEVGITGDGKVNNVYEVKRSTHAKYISALLYEALAIA